MNIAPLNKTKIWHLSDWKYDTYRIEKYDTYRIENLRNFFLFPNLNSTIVFYIFWFKGIILLF